MAQSYGATYSLFFFTHIYFLPASGQAEVTGVVSLLARGSCLLHKVQQSSCSSIFHRVFLTHALALSESQFVHKKKSPRIYASRLDYALGGIRTHETGLQYQAALSRIT